MIKKYKRSIEKKWMHMLQTKTLIHKNEEVEYRNIIKQYQND